MPGWDEIRRPGWGFRVSEPTPLARDLAPTDQYRGNRRREALGSGVQHRLVVLLELSLGRSIQALGHGFRQDSNSGKE